MSKLALEDNQMCYACGTKNPYGFRLNFEHPQKGVLKASVIFSEHHQGFKGIVHGGMMATLLDEVMLNLAWVEGAPAVTAELRVRLLKPAKTGRKIHFEGRLDDAKAKLLKTSAVAKNEKGEVLATARGTCVRIKIEVS